MESSLAMKLIPYLFMIIGFLCWVTLISAQNEDSEASSDTANSVDIDSIQPQNEDDIPLIVLEPVGAQNIVINETVANAEKCRFPEQYPNYFTIWRNETQLCLSCLELLDLEQTEKRKMYPKLVSPCETDDDCAFFNMATPLYGQCSAALSKKQLHTVEHWVKNWTDTLTSDQQTEDGGVERYRLSCGYFTPACLQGTLACQNNECTQVWHDQATDDLNGTLLIEKNDDAKDDDSNVGKAFFDDSTVVLLG